MLCCFSKSPFNRPRSIVGYKTILTKESNPQKDASIFPMHVVKSFSVLQTIDCIYTMLKQCPKGENRTCILYLCHIITMNAFA